MAKTENRPQRTCLLLVLMIVGIAGALVIGAAVYIYWRDNQPPPWWEDLSKISVELSDPFAAPQIKVLKLNDETNEDVTSIGFETMYVRYEYIYDGKNHIPGAKIVVNSEEKGYICVDSIVKRRAPEVLYYDPVFSIIDPGQYRIIYELYKDGNARETRSYFYRLSISIDII